MRVCVEKLYFKRFTFHKTIKVTSSTRVTIGKFLLERKLNSRHYSRKIEINEQETMFGDIYY